VIHIGNNTLSVWIPVNIYIEINSFIASIILISSAINNRFRGENSVITCLLKYARQSIPIIVRAIKYTIANLTPSPFDTL